MIVDSLKATIGKVDIVTALGLISISIFIVSKVQTCIVIFDSIIIAVDSRSVFIDRFTIGWSRGISRCRSWGIDRC
jgi:hypothetical protein